MCAKDKNERENGDEDICVVIVVVGSPGVGGKVKFFSARLALLKSLVRMTPKIVGPPLLVSVVLSH
jgi:hypothetical protein